MWRQAAFLAFSDARYLLRRRETRLWTFVLPVIFFYIIGAISERFAGLEREPMAVVVPSDAGMLADDLIKRIEQLGDKIVRVSDAKGYTRSLNIPPGFTQTVLDGKPVHLELRRANEGIDADLDRVRLARASYGVLGDAGLLAKGRPLGEVSTVTLDAKPAGKRRDVPVGFEHSVSGSMVFFMLMVLLSSGGVTLAVERDQGILRRLASAPMSRGAVVAGKWGARMLVGMIQMVFSMITGSLLFHVHWGAQLPMIVLVLIAFSSLGTAGGMLIGVFARSRSQAAAMGAVVANSLACIGGCWWPAEIMPRSMQAISRVTPAGIAMDALHQLVNFGAGAGAAVPHVLALSAMAIVAAALAAKLFRFQ